MRRAESRHSLRVAARSCGVKLRFEISYSKACPSEQVGKGRLRMSRTRSSRLLWASPPHGRTHIRRTTGMHLLALFLYGHAHILDRKKCSQVRLLNLTWPHICIIMKSFIRVSLTTMTQARLVIIVLPPSHHFRFDIDPRLSDTIQAAAKMTDEAANT
jgi:monoamine oxidase